MEPYKLSSKEALKAVTDDEIDPSLAAHCERAAVIQPSGRVAYDVIFDVEASNALAADFMEKRENRLRQQEQDDLARKEYLRDLGSRLLIWIVAAAIGLIFGAIYVALKH